MLATLKFMFPVWTSCMNFKFLYSTSYNIAPLECLIDISNLMYAKRNFWFSPYPSNCSSWKFSVSENDYAIFFSYFVQKIWCDPCNFSLSHTSPAPTIQFNKCYQFYPQNISRILPLPNITTMTSVVQITIIFPLDHSNGLLIGYPASLHRRSLSSAQQTEWAF